MGKLIYSLNVSLDGFVETPDHSLDWANVDDELHTWFNEQARGPRCVALRPADVRDDGRLLADGGVRPDRDRDRARVRRIWNATPKIVFSNTPQFGGLEQPAGRAATSATSWQRLRAEFSGDLDVGGADLAAAFIERGLVDEYRLLVHPVVLGPARPSSRRRKPDPAATGRDAPVRLAAWF